MKVVALIPAYNEESRLPATLEAVCSLEEVGEIVVVNDGSGDSTAEVVRTFQRRIPGRLQLVDLSSNQGKGAALEHGLAQAAGDVYLFLDADLGTSARQARALLDPVLEGRADMTVAAFTGGQSAEGKMGFGLVRRTAILGVRLLTGQQVTSPLSGQRAIRAELLRELGGLARGFGVEVSLTVGALHHGFRVLEVPLPMRHRAHGRGLRGFWHRGRQMVHVLCALWHCWRKGWHRWSGI